MDVADSVSPPPPPPPPPSAVRPPELSLPPPPEPPVLPPPPLILDTIIAPTRHDILPSPLDVPAQSLADPTVPPAESEDGSGSDREASDDDDNNDDDNDSSEMPRWYHIEEDKSVPCKDELAFITSKKEHSALDHAYWESKAFFDLNDPEIVPLESGKIEWLIDRFNGTKENPNNEHLMKSPVVRIGGLDWQVKFYPRGNHSDYLSIYIECISMLSLDFTELEAFGKPPFPTLKGTEALKKRRSVAVQFCVVMYNPAEPRVYEYQTEAHQFHKKSADYGWTYFTRLSRSEFHHRQHTQRQSILRDDKLALTAYIRVVKDPTGCLWQHGTPTPETITTVTGLRPFTKSFNYVAVAVPLLHFAPFRKFVRNLDDGSLLAKWLKPLLIKMYTRIRSASYASQSTIHEGDVMEMLWRISRSVQRECDENTAALFNELVGALHAEKGTPCSTNRLNTKDHDSIQAAVDKHAKIIACPSLLTMELQRQEHDKKARKWLKITNKVRVDDHIQVSGVSYTLFAFITHCGHLQSTRYNTYVRPNGIGNGWYAYQDGRVTCLTEKQARQIHSGSDTHDQGTQAAEDGYNSTFAEFHEPSGEVTCVVMYVRHDTAEEAFACPSTELWLRPLQVKEGDVTEPPKTAVHETFTGQGYTPCEVYCEPASDAAEARLATFADQLSQAAAVSTPEPVLYDGEDVIMRDADDDSAFALDLPEGEPLQGDLDVGTLDWLGRPYYQGQFHQSKYHGGGHLIMLNGDEYLGSFKDGKQHGYGKMIYSGTGNVYEGEWIEGQHHGRGKLIEHTTGNVFEGGWEQGRKHGEFVLTGTVTDEDQSCCTICYGKEITTAFYDCGHVVACHECAAMVDSCPVCRRRVIARLQLYGVKMTLA